MPTAEYGLFIEG